MYPVISPGPSATCHRQTPDRSLPGVTTPSDGYGVSLCGRDVSQKMRAAGWGGHCTVFSSLCLFFLFSFFPLSAKRPTCRPIVDNNMVVPASILPKWRRGPSRESSRVPESSSSASDPHRARASAPSSTIIMSPDYFSASGEEPAQPLLPPCHRCQKRSHSPLTKLPLHLPSSRPPLDCTPWTLMAEPQ
ncbi:uncharacterized protein BKA78DRAFT_327387 [Phyllosticta capitalensis]|uniref:Uncharacterized protein n=1 Tax=Phyllosticta capitalensis TaxID=121624 RepID=A0ABR1YDH7_9PEZI